MTSLGLTLSPEPPELKQRQGRAKITWENGTSESERAKGDCDCSTRAKRVELLVGRESLQPHKNVKIEMNKRKYLEEMKV